MYKWVCAQSVRIVYTPSTRSFLSSLLSLYLSILLIQSHPTIMGPRRHFKRNRKDQDPYPIAPQIRDAYAQLPTQFGKPPTTRRFPSSASGSNSTPLSTPEEVEMKRQIENAWRVRDGRERGGKFVDIGGFRVPAPPLPEVQGRSGEENKVLAEGFKMLMEENDEVSYLFLDKWSLAEI